MKAYLETIVVAQKEGGDVSTSVSQIMIEFIDAYAYNKFTETFEEFKLGFGAIVYAILAIAGGAFGIVNKFKKIV